MKYKRRKEGEDTKSSVHLAVVVSCVCEDFFCQARVTVAMSLLRVEMGENGDVEPKWTLLSK